MKIKLIIPCEHRDKNVLSAQTFKIQQLSLPLLAAFTPPEHQVKIVDESFAPDNIEEEVDLVGISVMTDLAIIAYRLADAYRQRGMKVVLGGIHATALPEEALQHADAVVVGEGEDVWGKLVTDASRGQLTKIYRAPGKADLSRRPLPRHDLYPEPSHKGYTPIAYGIETTRGCPYDCHFCSVALIMGRQYRVRPIQGVIAEISSLKRPDLFFVDDNLGMNRKAAKELFTEMIPLGCRWVGEGTVALAEDLELLRLMRRSGCEALLVGFESIQKEVQGSLAKTNRLKITFSEAVRRFHGEGIAIMGAFIFGFDYEDEDIFERTTEFALRNRIDLVELRSLMPYPGTQLYRTLLEENRLLVPEWWLKEITPGSLLYYPKSMTPDAFLKGLERISRDFYSTSKIIQRFFGIPPWKRSPLGWRLYFGANLAYRNRSVNTDLSLGIRDRQRSTELAASVS